MLTFRLQAYNAGTKYSGKLQERVHAIEEIIDCRAALRSRAFDNEPTKTSGVGSVWSGPPEVQVAAVVTVILSTFCPYTRADSECYLPLGATRSTRRMHVCIP